MQTRVWDIQEEMPDDFLHISCISVGESMLISGFNTEGVYEYSYCTGYKKIFETGRGSGILLKNSLGEIFLLRGGTIYRSSEDNYTEWWSVGSYDSELINKRLEGTILELGDSFYFTAWKYNCLKFNFKHLKVCLLYTSPSPRDS